MANQDASFNNQIFRKDNPIILACRRDKAVFAGARLLFDNNDYFPGQALVRNTSTGLFERWATLSGGSYDSPCVLFDISTTPDQFATGQGLGGSSGATLLRVLQSAIVYTNNLVGSDANFLTAIKAIQFTDAGGVAMTRF